MKTLDSGLNSAWWALRIGLGLGPFLAGLDKFFNILTTWEMYLSPIAVSVAWSTAVPPASFPAHRSADHRARTQPAL